MRKKFRNLQKEYVLWKGPKRTPKGKSRRPTIYWSVDDSKIGVDLRTVKQKEAAPFAQGKEISGNAEKLYANTGEKLSETGLQKRKGKLEVKIAVNRVNQILRNLKKPLKDEKRIELEKQLEELKKYLMIPKKVNLIRKTN